MKSKTQLGAILAGIFWMMAIPSTLHSLSPGSADAQSTPPIDVGLIVNSKDLFLNLDSYQGGIGAKISWGSLGFRCLLDFLVNGSDESFALNAGVAVEYHLGAERLSPYVGGFFAAGYMQQASVLTAVPLSFGALAGVEIFLVDFISVFVEYNIAVDVTFMQNPVGTPTTTTYLIEPRLGNNSEIGITIYLVHEALKK